METARNAWRRMGVGLAAGLVLAGVDPARASDSEDNPASATNDPLARVRVVLAPHTNYARILENNPIYLPSTGRIDVPFDMAREVAPELELVARLAQAAVDSSFRLRRAQEPDAYRFTNKNQEDCDLVVLACVTGTNTFWSTTVAEGERFFGKFTAIIQVESRKAPDGKVLFDVHLYGYPENALWRFVTRNVGVVQRYFRDRVMALISISTRTYEAMANEPGKILDAMERNRNPTNDLTFTQEEVDRIRGLIVRFSNEARPGSPPEGSPAVAPVPTNVPAAVARQPAP